MATQAYPYMVLTDGTTTITHQDGTSGLTNYPLVRDGWAPAIAGLRTSPLAGYTPYEDVVETYTIEINGTTATAALGRLATLTTLLDQAARWYRGENVTAVLMKIAPHGSTVSSTAAPLQAAVLGGEVGSKSGVALSARWDEVGRNFVIPEVQVTLVRRGLWLHTTTEASTPSAANNGELVTFTLTARDIKCPTKIALTNFGAGASGALFPGGFILVSDPVSSTAPIAIVNAEGGTAANYTSVSGSALNARNTSVLRYTPVNTGEIMSGAIDPSLPSTTTLVAIFANIRPSATVTFTVRMRVDSVLAYQFTPYVVIEADSNQTPKWFFLGLVPISGAIVHTYLRCTADSASTTLDIDTVVYCDANAVQVVSFGNPKKSGGYDFFTVVGTGTIDHGLLSKITPSFVDDTTPMIRKGDAVIMTKDATVYALLLATGGGTTSIGISYRQADTGTDAVLANTWTATRSTAYLVPQ